MRFFVNVSSPFSDISRYLALDCKFDWIERGFSTRTAVSLLGGLPVLVSHKVGKIFVRSSGGSRLSIAGMSQSSLKNWQSNLDEAPERRVALGELRSLALRMSLEGSVNHLCSRGVCGQNSMYPFLSGHTRKPWPVSLVGRPYIIGLE